MPKARGARAPKKDPLDLFAEAPLDRVLQLVFWKLRHKNPDMAVLIEQKDLEAFKQSMDYQEVKPALLVYRPQGDPGHPGSPAVGKRRAVPARDPSPARPFVVVALVQEGTKNTVKPVENNEQDYQRGDLARRQAVARGRAGSLATTLRNGAANLDLVTSGVLEEAAETLSTLAAT